MIVRPAGSRERGQILPMVALMAVVLIAMIGIAIDVGRIMVVKAQLARAVDAAALAGSLKLPDMQAAADEAYLYIKENEPDADSGTTTSPGDREVKVVATEKVDLTFLSVLTLIPGIHLEDPVTVTAEAVAGFGVQHVDVYLDLDATGSMKDGCDSWFHHTNCPIEETKEAATNFANTLLEDTAGGNVQVGLGGFRGCYNPPWNGMWSYCVPVSSMVNDLTVNKGQITSTIAHISADGYTNICSGMKKGQDILFGSHGQTGPYTRKILVVLSDGDNNYAAWTYNGSNSPDPACQPTSPTQSDQDYTSDACLSAHTQQKKLDIKTRNLADTLKNNLGVEIYVVGFGVCRNSPDTHKNDLCDLSLIGGTSHDNIANRNLLKCIASSTPGTNDHYFEVDDATQLPDIFSQIAQRIGFRLVE